MGLSLGGLVAATVASIDEPHAVLLLVPAVDLPGLAADATRNDQGSTAESDLLVRARPLFAPVSPLLLSPKVPVERRFIVAGTLDRFARPSSQAVALWRHWDQPTLHWYHGGHVSIFWAGDVQAGDRRAASIRRPCVTTEAGGPSLPGSVGSSSVVISR